MTRTALASLAFLTLLEGSALAADVGLSQETPDQWRASKLAGVPIYGPDDKRVGKITDVLMSHEGKAQYVVVGIGGFLGIGEKDVAVPFDQVVFTDEPLKQPPSTMGGAAATTATVPDTNGNAPAAATTDGSGVPPTSGAASLGAPVATSAGADSTSMAAHAAPSTAYPDHGRISLTVEQLKSAPSFKFGS